MWSGCGQSTVDMDRLKPSSIDDRVQLLAPPRLAKVLVLRVPLSPRELPDLARAPCTRLNASELEHPPRNVLTHLAGQREQALDRLDREVAQAVGVREDGAERVLRGERRRHRCRP